MKKLHIFSLLFFCCGLLILCGDAFSSPHTIYNLLGFQSENIVIPSLIFLLILRIKGKIFLNSHLKRVLTILVACSFIITSILTLYDAVTPANALFALTRLHQSQLWLITVFSGLVLLLNYSYAWWKQHWRKCLALLPFLGLYLLFNARSFPFDFFDNLVKEDNFIEYAQFFVLLAGGIGSIWIAKQAYKKKKTQWSFFFAVIALAFLLVAGDEISWGQRLLGIETSESVKQVNAQQEYTFHNLYIFNELVVYGYVVVAFWGVYSFSVTKKIKSWNTFIPYTPHPILIGYFFLPLVYFALQILIDNGIWHLWAEVSELYLYSGIVLWILLLGRELYLKKFDT